MKVEHILLPTDLSDEARRAYVTAASLARDTGAKITLLSIVEDLKVTPHGAPFAPPIGDPDAPQEAKALLGQLATERDLIDAKLDVQCDTAIGEDLGETIAWYAKDKGCDMVVMSTHGRSGFRRMILGSVAEQVLRHSDVPVLCVPHVED